MFSRLILSKLGPAQLPKLVLKPVTVLPSRSKKDDSRDSRDSAFYKRGEFEELKKRQAELSSWISKEKKADEAGDLEKDSKDSKESKELAPTAGDQVEKESAKERSVYDFQETVEEVRARLRKESEICHSSVASQYMYPAGWDYAMKFERIYDLEKCDTKPFKDLGAGSLAISNVLIIGGGLVGTSIAYWLRELGIDMLDVNVIDRDYKYLHSNSALSVTGLQQQFSTREFIELSQVSAEFLRTTRRHLNVFNKEPPDVDYCPTGNLILCKPENVDAFLESVAMQNQLGLRTILMNREQLREQFPWLNCDDVELGSIGLENEGHFNSQSLLRAMKIKAENLQARFWECEFVDFNQHLIKVIDPSCTPLKLERTRRALIRDKGNELFQIDFDSVVICCGPENAEFGRLLGLGDPEHPEPVMRFPLPLKKRKRYFYVFECDEGPGIDFPLMIDPSGVFCRMDGYAGRYITGKLPGENEEEIDNNNSDVDYKYFENVIQPVLAARVPAFRNLRLLRGWSCFEDVNTIDQMPILGHHPFFENVTIVGGLGVHAAALAPAIGKCIAEKLLYDEYQTVDLTRFGWERFFIDNKFDEEQLKF